MNLRFSQIYHKLLTTVGLNVKRGTARPCPTPEQKLKTCWSDWSTACSDMRTQLRGRSELWVEWTRRILRGSIWGFTGVGCVDGLTVSH